MNDIRCMWVDEEKPDVPIYPVSVDPNKSMEEFLKPYVGQPVLMRIGAGPVVELECETANGWTVNWKTECESVREKYFKLEKQLSLKQDDLIKAYQLIEKLERELQDERAFVRLLKRKMNEVLP